MSAALLAATGSFQTSDLIELIVVVVLIGITGFLALSETALTRMSKVKAMSLEEEGGKRAKTLRRLVEHTDRVLPVILFALEITTLVAATLVGMVADHLVGAIGVVVGVAFEIAVIFVLAELAPKTWAIQHTERAALMAAPVIRLLVLFAPLRWMTMGLIRVSNAILPGKGIPQGPYTSDEMIRAMASEAAQEEVIEKDEAQLIHSIIDFGDTVVRDVMIPRPDMVAVESHARIRDVVDIAIAAGFTRIPAFGQGIDDIIGLIFVKDLLKAEREDRQNHLVSEILREAQFTPESKKISDLMAEMRASKQHMAIVVDEYGGTAGLVTLEDLIEELVGEISDEYDADSDDVELISPDVLVVSARMPISDANDSLPRGELPEGDWDTVGGLIYSSLGQVPTEGEKVEVDGFTLVAEGVEGRRIGKVRITLPPEVPAEEEDEERWARRHDRDNEREDEQTMDKPVTDKHAAGKQAEEAK